jgi:tetratricopeptide (TPR) repeat protein
MRRRSAILVSLFFLSSIAIAQNHSTSAFSEDTFPSLMISGKVVSADGSLAPGGVAIQTECGGQSRIQTYTAQDGTFVFTLDNFRAGQPDTSAPQVFGSTAGFGRDLQFCSVIASLPGYLSEGVQLSGTSGTSSIDVGNLTLHHVGKQIPSLEDEMVSATSLSAPAKAKRDFERGRQYEQKQQWSAAAQQFQKAVSRYSQYADAWTDLGQAQEKLGDMAAAQQSFHRAIASDPRSLRPYIELTDLAARQKQWQELAQTTAHALEQNPDGFPQFWLLNSVANYNLHQFGQAEQSDLRGLSIDRQHRVPKLEYLCGLIMAVNHNYRAAAQHLRAYLNLAPHASDLAVVAKQLSEVEKLADAVPQPR